VATRDISEEQRKRLLAELDAKLDEGLADVKAGRVHTSEEVWDAVRQRIRDVRAKMAMKRA
jgi:predicted transcriptional regulator